MVDVLTGSGRITKRVVDAAAPQQGRYFLWDADLKGFGLRVEPSGAKSYVVRYRTGGGRTGQSRQFMVGKHGAITPDIARKEAAKALGEVALGRDPQGTRREARAELTLDELCDLYLREGCITKKASTIRIDRIRIARHIKPLLGRKRLSAIGPADIDQFMTDVALGRTRDLATPHTRGGKAAASRSVGLLGGIFAFAVKRRFVDESPTVGVKRFKDNRRDRFLSGTELAKLGEALMEFEAEGMNPSFVAIIRLLALTGARKNEIAGLRWREVDFERGMLRLGDSKTGAKVAQLGAAAIELLSTMEENSDFVFPDPRDFRRPVRGLDWAWVRIRERAGLPGVRVHDLRHSFASAGLAGGQALPLIGKLLGHSHVSTTSRYAHLADDPLRVAADSISAMISGALNGRSAEVVPISLRSPTSPISRSS